MKSAAKSEGGAGLGGVGSAISGCAGRGRGARTFGWRRAAAPPEEQLPAGGSSVLGFHRRRHGRRGRGGAFLGRRRAHGRRSRAHNMLGTATGGAKGGRKKQHEECASSHIMHS